ncbi:response regulator [Clostridium sp. MCC353]|uniref:LytR/AlgR family response regulator transcription factor n=1 Tax=Clostridium sp. MCC353 TaxID=2592646 RepID=UPI001C02D359|nr:LytTR family DNA-binding domain-containing protein [Clostridium sp. MCC353]MBT9775694.1 response regulator [Clostridium sp. MCC353]
MNIAICDDEQEELNQIKKYTEIFLERNMFEASVFCFSRGGELIEAIGTRSFELVLLDIYMDGMNGIETAEKIRELLPGCEIIFITISTDHALEGYRVKAIDYLIKPVLEEGLQDSLGRCFRHFTNVSRMVTVKSGRRELCIPARTILWAEIYGHQLTIHTAHQDIAMNGSMEELENLLGGMPFYRISKSYLIQLKAVDKMKNGRFYMTDGSFVPIPCHPRYRKSVEKVYNDYLFGQSQANGLSW